MAENAGYTKLKNRGLVHIEGADRLDFLQNLITNDLNRLKPGAALYACLLTPQGKFLHDFFVSQGDGFLLLDCEGGERAQDLARRLNMYRLRADVQISSEEDVPVYAILPPLPNPPPAGGREAEGGWGGAQDPRHKDMGYRTFEKPDGLPEVPFEDWDTPRIRLTIPDGSRDLIPDKSTMDEGRMDQLNAIDYEKGCYVGQELTARMHYRGLGKKHLYTIEGAALPAPGEPILSDDGKTIGEMRSSCRNWGLALIKDAKVSAIQPDLKITSDKP